MRTINVLGFSFEDVTTKAQHLYLRGLTIYQDPTFPGLVLVHREVNNLTGTLPYHYYQLRYDGLVKTEWLGDPESCIKAVLSLVDLIKQFPEESKHV